jgi:hypothetical protein
MMAQNVAPGNVEMASGYATNTSPGPVTMATSYSMNNHSKYRHKG